MENKQYLISRLRKRVDQALIPISTILKFSALETLEWDNLNPDRLINLEIMKKRRSSINPDIPHAKVPSSGGIKNNLVTEIFS